MSSQSARLLADDPRTLFGTAREMFAVDYGEIRALQLEALRYRFDSLHGKVQLLSRLAERNGVDAVDGFAAASRLLYPSNVYKSYPFDWLVDNRFDRLTRWLAQLTAHNLADVDVAEVESLDNWFERLEAVTELRVCHSSSTSGKLSFLPRGVDEWVRRTATLPFAHEAAGSDPGPKNVSYEGLPMIIPFYRYGHSATIMGFEWFIRCFTDPQGTNPELVLSLYDGALSSDLMVLAGRLRSGQLNGDPKSMQLPKRLLDRRSELSGLLEGTADERMREFVQTAGDRFGGQRCMVSGVWPSVVDAAQAGLAMGQRHLFDPASRVSAGGGEKGRILPANVYEMVLEWSGVDTIANAYGMSELMGANAKCSLGKFHLNPWLVPFVLDSVTLEPLPARGRSSGRFAGIDLMASSYWSGYISTDVVTITWDPGCECGRNGPYLDSEIRRAENVEDDKISCAATPSAHDDVIEFLQAHGA